MGAPIVPIGTEIDIEGEKFEVIAVGNGGTLGERYYWLAGDGDVAMWPASFVEVMVREPGSDTVTG